MMGHLNTRDGMQYGYRFVNRLSGEVMCDREFETREEMEKALKADLDPKTLLGELFATLPTEGK